MRRRRRWVQIVAACSALVACGGATTASLPTDLAGTAAQVHVLSARVTLGAQGTAEASLALHNAGAQTDRLTGVSCTCAIAAELHGASQAGDLGPVDSIALPPDEEVELGSGGPHVVLLGLTQPLAPGDTVTLQLTFETAPPTTAVAEVNGAKTPSPAG